MNIWKFEIPFHSSPPPKTAGKKSHSTKSKDKEKQSSIKPTSQNQAK
jgi:hypothetical protein